MSDTLKAVWQAFSPGYFAAVMATGIISIACHLGKHPQIADGLFYLNIIFYITFWVLLILKLFLSWTDLKNLFTDFMHGPTFLTIVAGTCILGTQFVMLRHSYGIGLGLLVFALFLWFPLLFGFYALASHSSDKPSLEKGINGSWLLSVVGTQAIPVLGLTLAQSMPTSQSLSFYFLMLGFHLLGGFLYVPNITLLLYRLLFFPLESKDFTPPYWICMGAAAITVLAGSKLLIADIDSAFLQHISSFLKGETLLFWMVGNWCMLLVLLLEIWRYWIRKYPICYEVEYWSMVFPLGMYMVSTNMLGKAFHLDFFKQLAQPFLYIALIVWVLTLLGMFGHALRGSVSRA